uniref:Uncharacterized protein n=2 Tax=Anguilla anguilla TaxID=7936 RepID=A0A0E9T519_ANGAN
MTSERERVHKMEGAVASAQLYRAPDRRQPLIVRIAKGFNRTG